MPEAEDSSNNLTHLLTCQQTGLTVTLAAPELWLWVWATPNVNLATLQDSRDVVKFGYISSVQVW
jgi:hypothetical protein